MKNLSLLSYDSYFQYIREEIEDFKANSASENILGGLKPTTEQLDALGCTKSWRQRIHQSASHSIDRIDRKGTRQLEQSSQRERSLSTGRDSRPLVSHPDYARILSHGFFAADPFSSIAISIEASIDWKSARFREIVPRNIVLDYYRWRIWNI